MDAPAADTLATVAAGRTAAVVQLRQLVTRLERLPLDAPSTPGAASARVASDSARFTLTLAGCAAHAPTSTTGWRGGRGRSIRARRR
jgi:hypothetical protein